MVIFVLLAIVFGIWIYARSSYRYKQTQVQRMLFSELSEREKQRNADKT